MNTRAGLLDFRVLWLPGWLYEVMPFVYVLGGLLAIVTFDSVVGTSSGLLCSIAGISILVIRWRHRNAIASDRTVQTRLKPSQASTRSYYNDPWG